MMIETGCDKTLFDHHLMTDALLKEIGQFLFFHKVHDLAMVLSRQNIRRRVGMIEMQNDLVLVEDRLADISKCLNG